MKKLEKRLKLCLGVAVITLILAVASKHTSFTQAQASMGPGMTTKPVKTVSVKTEPYMHLAALEFRAHMHNPDEYQPISKVSLTSHPLFNGGVQQMASATLK